jgi:phosphatidylinositol alpha-1,6-mannosyltransferase
MPQSSICYLVPDLFGPPGGIARHGRTVCQALLDAGLDLSVLALLDPPKAQQNAPTPLASMHYQSSGGNRKLFVKQALSLVKRRPALVLVEHPNFAPLGWLVARLSRVPLVVIAHGIDIWEPLSPIRQKALGQANQVICVSRFTAEKAAQANGIALQKTRVLHNCLEPGFVPHPEGRTNESSLSLLTVARISLSEQYKGHDYIIRSLPKLLEKFPQLIYDIVGDGDGRASLEQLAADLGVASAVRFHGKVSEEELLHRYQEASIFVMPSRGEGFGIAFLEAMVHGLPVIGGNLDASPEVISDGETGLVVDPTSDVAIAGAIEKLLSDAELRRRMGNAGQQRALSTFSYEHFRYQLLQHLMEVAPLWPTALPIGENRT